MNEPILPNLAQILANFGNIVPAIFLVMRAIAGLMAVVLSIHALVTLYRISQGEVAGAQNKSIMGPLVEVIVAGLLLSLSQDGLVVQNIVANLTTQVNFQMPQQFALAPAQQDLNDLRIAVGLAIENIMFLVGTFAIMRGLLVLKRMSYGDQNHKLSAVLSYLISGSMALNIVTIARIFDGGLGTKFSQILFGR